MAASGLLVDLGSRINHHARSLAYAATDLVFAGIKEKVERRKTDFLTMCNAIQKRRDVLLLKPYSGEKRQIEVWLPGKHFP